MDDKQRPAMEAANPYSPPGGAAEFFDARKWNDGAEWMHAHDAEKLAMAEAYVSLRSRSQYTISHEEIAVLKNAQRIIAEAKEDTDGNIS